MSVNEIILQLATQAKIEGIPLERARFCTVCWTVHEEETCPQCQAHQWLYLAPMLQGLDQQEYPLQEEVKLD